MIRENKPLGNIEPSIKEELFNKLGITANTYEDLFN